MSEAGPPPVPGNRGTEERERALREREGRRIGPTEDGSRVPSNGHRSPLYSFQPARPPRRRRAGLLVLGVAALAVVWLAVSLLEPFRGAPGREVQVTVPPGAGVDDIARLLEQEGVVANAFLFEIRATLAGRRGDLKPGFYRLRRDASYGAVIDTLAAGPPLDVVNVTVPEGRSRREVASILRGSTLQGDYLKETVTSRAIDVRRYGARGARSLEGFLFPATYELPRGASVRTLVHKQLESFDQAFATVDMRGARQGRLTPHQVLTIASMVEREAQAPAERPVIASVIYNRLRRGIPLGIDATVRFVTGNWTRPLTASQLQVDSPYNTRVEAGLPPGPIGSPGLEAIRAAASPPPTPFLYYVVKPGTCGEHAFSETLEQFNRDRASYEAERARRGGQSPTTC